MLMRRMGVVMGPAVIVVAADRGVKQ
jgi:hypothetical protein